MNLLFIFTFLIAATITLAGFIFLNKYYSFVSHILKNKLPFTKDAESTKKWINSVNEGYNSFYFFNITNVDEFLSNNVPLKVEEVGPFVYRFVFKINIDSWNENETLVSFNKNKTYYFEPDLSVGNLDQVITTLNFPLVAAINSLYARNNSYLDKSIIKTSIKKALKNTDENLFIEKSINQLLFQGFEIPFVQELLKKLNLFIPKSTTQDNFGFMYKKNNTVDDLWTVHTGYDDILKIGEVVEYNRTNLNKCWNDEKCGRIYGSDGSRFHILMDHEKDSIINTYSSSLFRTISLKYKKTYDLKGITLDKYDMEFVNFLLKLDKNRCYCPNPKLLVRNESICNIDGLLDISNCKKRPLVISAPHFLFADNKIYEMINISRANYEKHVSYISLDPLTGIAMSARRRLQINAHLRKFEFDIYENIDDTLVPIFWVEEKQEISEKKAQLLLDTVHRRFELYRNISKGLLIVGIFLILLHFIVYLITNSRLNKKNRNLQKSIKYQHEIKCNYVKANNQPIEYNNENMKTYSNKS